MIKNPFFHVGPVRDPGYFYNRNKEVKHILEMVGQGQSIAVVGPRKIGKTSLLFYIAQPSVMKAHGLDPSKHLVVYLDCEGLGGINQKEFRILVLEEVAECAGRYGIKFTIPEQPISHLEFVRALRQLFDQHCKLTLLLDEFESFNQNPNVDEDLLSGLRSLAMGYNLAYVTVSKKPLAAFTSNTHSPFFNIFLLAKIGLFDEAGSRALIEGSLRKIEGTFSEDIIEELLRLGGGHPFFLQVVCRWALELQNTKGSPLAREDLGVLYQTVAGQIESHFTYYWNHLSAEERYVLTTLPLAQDRGNYKAELKSLADACLITKGQDRYTYFSPLFRDFVRRQTIDEVLQTDPLVLDLVNQQALLREELLSLSPRQFALLRYLMAYEGRVVTNEELDREVLATEEERQDYRYMGDDRLKSAIRELRKSLNDKTVSIDNRRGIGYMIRFQMRA